MTKQHWGWVGGVLWIVSGCGGRAAGTTDGLSSAGRSDSGDAAGGRVAVGRSTGGSNSVGGSVGGSGSRDTEAGAPENGGDAGSGPGCTGKLADVSKALGIECPPELCAGTVAALACDALPVGVVKTSEAACEQVSTISSQGRIRTLRYELTATRRKDCYYDEADFEAPATLVGAQAWDDSDSFCMGSASRVSAGTVPSSDCGYASSATLCDLAHPAQSAPVVSGVPPRACFNGWSATCEPCCDSKPPDCTNQPNGYPGFDCTPPASEDKEVSYCSCSCDTQIWNCAC
jgi:hypothetical protein